MDLTDMLGPVGWYGDDDIDSFRQFATNAASQPNGHQNLLPPGFYRGNYIAACILHDQ